MKLSEFKKEYQWFSAKASDVVRQLAFAGIALVWIFKQGDINVLLIPKQLFWPSIFLASALATDLLHYVVASIIWGSFHWWNENKKKKENSDPDIKANKKLNWPTIFLFWTKIVFVIIAYALIIIYIYERWKVIL